MTMVKFNNKPFLKDFDNLLHELFATVPDSWNNPRKEPDFHFPPVNIHETKDAYHLEFNVPGRTKEDFTITAEGGQLVIGFEKKEEPGQEDYKTIRREFSYRNFKRSFQVDDSIKVDGIQARYENGLLKLLLPKKDDVKGNNKQITIQ